MSENGMDGDVGRAKIAANVFLCLEFTEERYHVLIASSTIRARTASFVAAYR